MNSWLRLIVGSTKSNLGRWMGHMPPIWTILCMCFALGLPQIWGASRAASAFPGGVYEKTRFRESRKFGANYSNLRVLLLLIIMCNGFAGTSFVTGAARRERGAGPAAHRTAPRGAPRGCGDCTAAQVRQQRFRNKASKALELLMNEKYTHV